MSASLVRGACIRRSIIRRNFESSPFIYNGGCSRSMGHTVLIILQDDLPGGKGYVGEVVTVKAG